MSKGLVDLLCLLLEQSMEQAQRVQALAESAHLLTAAVAVALDVRSDRDKVVSAITQLAPPVAKVGIGYQATLERIAGDPVRDRLRPVPVRIETVSDHLEQAMKLFANVAQQQQETAAVVGRVLAVTSETKAELSTLWDSLHGRAVRSEASASS